MKNVKIGNSIEFRENVYIKCTSSMVSKKEGEGPLKDYYDKIIDDLYFGEDSWEKAESKFITENFKNVIEKSDIKIEDVDYIITGDLLNQCIGSSFGIREFERPVFSVYGACSTMGESMSLGAILIDGGYANNILAGASSHFCSAEKQFRSPLELGNQRPLTATTTVTGDGAVILSKEGNKNMPVIKRITTGKIVDLGVKDPFNMGGAMAPAACDIIVNHLKDFNLSPDYYDLIITGDLGYIGQQLVVDMAKKFNIDLSKNYTDCGILIYDKQTQDTHAGGSGCGCSAVTYAGYLHTKLTNRELKKILFIPTGALLSTVSTAQGESIPCIAHAVGIEMLD